MPTTDGGPAFPVPISLHGSGWSEGAFDAFHVDGNPGMTLRDYAEVHFTAAWIAALGADLFREVKKRSPPSTEDLDTATSGPANLGRATAAAWLKSREER